MNIFLTALNYRFYFFTHIIFFFYAIIANRFTDYFEHYKYI